MSRTREKTEVNMAGPISQGIPCTKLHLMDLMTLNGKKSYLGLLVIVAGVVVQHFGNDYVLSEQLIDGGKALFGVGAVHKLDKLTKAVQK
jgi:hypothetical protein